MFNLDKGTIETYYEIAAYEKPENFFTTIKQFDKYEEAKSFCKENNYELRYYYNDVIYNCKLIIIKVISEIL